MNPKVQQSHASSSAAGPEVQPRGSAGGARRYPQPDPDPEIGTRKEQKDCTWCTERAMFFCWRCSRTICGDCSDNLNFYDAGLSERDVERLDDWLTYVAYDKKGLPCNHCAAHAERDEFDYMRWSDSEAEAEDLPQSARMAMRREREAPTLARRDAMRHPEVQARALIAEVDTVAKDRARCEADSIRTAHRLAPSTSR